MSVKLPGYIDDVLRGGPLVPFVGAGVSAAVRRAESGAPAFPTWTKLLSDALGDARSKGLQFNPLAEALEDGDLVSAATAARECFKGTPWLDRLRGIFGLHETDVDPASLELSRAIWALDPALVVTTNYDDVLWWTCRPRTERWVFTQEAERARFLRGNAPGPVLWHLHGHHSDVAHLILDQAAYPRLYGHAPNAPAEFRSARETLRQIIVGSTLLFVGFSLEDAAIRALLDDVDGVFRGATGPHLMLVRQAEYAAAAARLHGAPIHCVPYAEHGQPLIDTLRAIAERRAWQHGPSTAPVAGPAPLAEPGDGLLVLDERGENPNWIADWTADRRGPVWRVPAAASRSVFDALRVQRDPGTWTACLERIEEVVDQIRAEGPPLLHVMPTAPYALGLFLGRQLKEKSPSTPMCIYQREPGGAPAWTVFFYQSDRWTIPTAFTRPLTEATLEIEGTAGDAKAVVLTIEMGVHCPTEAQLEQLARSAGSAKIHRLQTEVTEPAATPEGAPRRRYLESPAERFGAVRQVGEALNTLRNAYPEAVIHLMSNGPLALSVAVGWDVKASVVGGHGLVVWDFDSRTRRYYRVMDAGTGEIHLDAPKPPNQGA